MTAISQRQHEAIVASIKGAWAMQTRKDASKRIDSKFGRSLGLLAAACLWPAIATAQPPDPTASDAYGNTAAGTNALLAVTPTNTQGSHNTAVGNNALLSTTTGSFNTGLGDGSLFTNTTGEENTAAGARALFSNTTGADNTASGFQTLTSNTTGSLNTAGGAYALWSNTTGNQNAAFGYQALQANTDGDKNTASGAYALYSNTSGSSNAAFGALALYHNTAGDENTASGVGALQSNTTGSDNTASGVYALVHNTVGKNNTAAGAGALEANVNGSNNVAVGFGALKALAGSSNNNIAIGTNAGNVTKSGRNNIYIGNPGATTESSVTRIGRVQTKSFVAGIAGVPLSGATVVVNSAGQLGVVASSARYKQDITPLTGASEKLAQLRPVSYRYKAEPDARHYGLIAEEVDKVMPDLVVRDEEGRPESVQYHELIPLLLQERQELRAELARQRALIEQQAKALAALSRRLDARVAALDPGDKEGAAGLK
jgi:hypothetical protein